MRTEDLFIVIGGVLLSALIITFYVRMSRTSIPRIDEIFKNPEKYRKDDEWLPEAREVVEDEAFIAACEIMSPNDFEFDKIAEAQETRIWNMLEAKLMRTTK